MKYQPKSGPDNEALVKILADGQDQFQKWFAHKKITSILSDAELIAEYIADADVVFGAFHDDEYDRDWGLLYDQRQGRVDARHRSRAPIWLEGWHGSLRLS
jgi:hypothetical protein